MSYEISDEERAEILTTENVASLDVEGTNIEIRAPIFLRIANAVPLPIWRIAKIGLWITLGIIAILEIYLLV